MPDLADRAGGNKLPRLLKRGNVTVVRLTMPISRAPATALVISSACAKLVASGYSQNTCLPPFAISSVVP